MTCIGKTNTQNKVKVPLLKEYNINTPLEFILFNFHDYFDGILGIRDLRKLNLNIDFVNQRLCNKKISIPLQYRQDFTTQKVEIPANTSVLKKIFTTLPDDTELFFPAIKNKILEIPASLLRVENGFVTLEMRNLLDHSILIAFSPHDIESKCSLFFEEEHELFNIEQISEANTHQEIEKPKSNDFSLIRSDHLNEEKKK